MKWIFFSCFIHSPARKLWWIENASGVLAWYNHWFNQSVVILFFFFHLISSDDDDDGNSSNLQMLIALCIFSYFDLIIIINNYYLIDQSKNNWRSTNETSFHIQHVQTTNIWLLHYRYNVLARFDNDNDDWMLNDENYINITLEIEKINQDMRLCMRVFIRPKVMRRKFFSLI